jgi:SAM-dependent methyltransferase
MPHSESIASGYDEVRYPSRPVAQAHPDHLATVAYLHGLTPASPSACRVLELGCGSGAHLLPLAQDYPGSRFLGIDLAEKPVASAGDITRQLGLGNLTFLHADILDWDESGREFDYVIAHGIYSWVPEAVRHRILDICSRCLSPEGVAFISYNALPGSNLRRFVWDLLRYNTRAIADPLQRIARARALAESIDTQLSWETVLNQILKLEMRAIKDRADGAIFHDDLAPVNEPFHLFEFVEQAFRHGLDYIGDADMQRDNIEEVPLPPGDWIELRQYADFFAGRRFRESLLCRKHDRLERDLCLDRLNDLWVASRCEPQAEQPDGAQRFVISEDNALTTNNPAVKDLLIHLVRIWPRSVRAGEIRIDNLDPDALPVLLNQLALNKAIELRMTLPRLATEVSDKPATSELARLQVSSGQHSVTNQRHMEVRLPDELSRAVVSLLDGTRNHDAILESLVAMVESGTPIPGLDEAPHSRQEIREVLAGKQEDSLQGLARACLLVA